MQTERKRELRLSFIRSLIMLRLSQKLRASYHNPGDASKKKGNLWKINLAKISWLSIVWRWVILIAIFVPPVLGHIRLQRKVGNHPEFEQFANFSENNKTSSEKHRKVTQWEVHQYLSNGEWINWDFRFSGCNLCSSTMWFGCGEGMYYVMDKQVCVQDCRLADELWSESYSPSPSLHRSKYYADSWSMQWRTWSRNCARWVNEVGCISWIQDKSQMVSPYIIYRENGLGEWVNCSEIDPGWALWSEDGIWIARIYAALESKEPCAVSNCISWNFDATIWEKCDLGFVLENNEWMNKICSVSNCVDCLDESIKKCSGWSIGYYLELDFKWESWQSNWVECSSASNWSKCEIGLVLSSTGSWIQECSSSEYVELTVYNPPFQGVIYASKSCQAPQCHSSCSDCLDNSKSEKKCTRWPTGFYLAIADHQTFSGICKLKLPKSETQETLIFVSNRVQDYLRIIEEQDGSKEHPFVNLITAIEAVKFVLAEHNYTDGGEILSVRIAMFVGKHYVIRNNDMKYLANNYNNFDSQSLNYKVIVSPYYCYFDDSVDLEIWTNQIPMDYSEAKVDVIVKIGQRLTFYLPKDFEIDGIHFDFTDSIIPFDDDPVGWSTSREQCCQINGGQIDPLR